MIGLLISNNCLAADQTVILKKDERAPFEGVLLPFEQANKTRYELLDCDIKKQLNGSYERTIKLYKDNEVFQDNKVNILMKQNDELAKALTESKTSSDLQKVVWFTLGVLATGLAIYGTSKISK
jgi:hypothetical protein